MLYWLFKLTVSISSFLLASPMLLRAMSTSFWPGRQLTQLFREWDTALATWNRTVADEWAPSSTSSSLIHLSVRNPHPNLTCASLCWLSASPGEPRASLASWMRRADPSMTSRAESNMAAAALGSVVEAATPRAAWARVFRAWAVSLAAIPKHKTRRWRGRGVTGDISDHSRVRTLPLDNTAVNHSTRRPGCLTSIMRDQEGNVPPCESHPKNIRSIHFYRLLKLIVSLLKPKENFLCFSFGFTRVRHYISSNVSLKQLHQKLRKKGWKLWGEQRKAVIM